MIMLMLSLMMLCLAPAPTLKLDTTPWAGAKSKPKRCLSYEPGAPVDQGSKIIKKGPFDPIKTPVPDPTLGGLGGQYREDPAVEPEAALGGLGGQYREDPEVEPFLSQASSTFAGLVSSQDSPLPGLSSPLSPSKYSVEATMEDELPEPEVRSTFVFSTPGQAARFHLASVTEAHRAVLNLPPTTSSGVFSNVDTLIASLPGSLPPGTCVILEPQE